METRNLKAISMFFDADACNSKARNSKDSLKAAKAFQLYF